MIEIDFRTDLLPLKDKVFRLALRITASRDEAEDITQDVLLRVWERRDEMPAVASLEAYVLTAAHNTALDRLRRSESRNITLEEQHDTTPDATPTADERMEHDERLRRVHDIFARLPERQRTVMQLRDIEGKTTRETADITGLTEENVKVTLLRARRAVREQYEKIENYGL